MKIWLSVLVVDMLDSGGSCWVPGGDMLLLTANGGFDGGCAGCVLGR